MTATNRALEQNGCPRHLCWLGAGSPSVLIDGAYHHGLEVIGPMKVERPWQAQAGREGAPSVSLIDWETQRVTYPGGRCAKEGRTARTTLAILGSPAALPRPVVIVLASRVLAAQNVECHPQAACRGCSRLARHIPPHTKRAMPSGRGSKARFRDARLRLATIAVYGSSETHLQPLMCGGDEPRPLCRMGQRRPALYHGRIGLRSACYIPDMIRQQSPYVPATPSANRYALCTSGSPLTTSWSSGRVYRRGLTQAPPPPFAAAAARTHESVGRAIRRSLQVNWLRRRTDAHHTQFR